MQHTVICEEQLQDRAAGKRALKNAQVVIIPPAAKLLPNERTALDGFEKAGGSIVTAEGNGWLQTVQNIIKRPSIVVSGSQFVRAVVHDQGKRTIVHLLNLNLEKVNSFTDRVHPAENLRLTVRVNHGSVRQVRALTADQQGTAGWLDFKAVRSRTATVVELEVPRVEIATLMVIE